MHLQGTKPPRLHCLDRKSLPLLLSQSQRADLWILPLFGDRKPFVYLQTICTEGYGQFSPDAKLIAYQSDISGRAEIYVEPFPRVESESRGWQISIDGGGLPRWRNDGKELFFMTARGEVMSVDVTPGANPSFAAPRLLFQSRALPRVWGQGPAVRRRRRLPCGHDRGRESGLTAAWQR